MRSRVLYAILRDYAGNVFALLGWVGRRRAERRLSCRFPNIERAAAQLSPRPWLMIHGDQDAYIGPEIAQRLLAEAGEPKELLDRARGQAQPLPRSRRRRLRRTGRVVPRPVRPARPTYR